jgi:hypothetical protein
MTKKTAGMTKKTAGMTKKIAGMTRRGDALILLISGRRF